MFPKFVFSIASCCNSWHHLATKLTHWMDPLSHKNKLSQSYFPSYKKYLNINLATFAGINHSKLRLISTSEFYPTGRENLNRKTFKGTRDFFKKCVLNLAGHAPTLANLTSFNWSIKFFLLNMWAPELHITYYWLPTYNFHLHVFLLT